MAEATNRFMAALEGSQRVVERIFAAAQPGAVFGEPVRSGEYTLITASEITAAGGFGSGGGVGPGEEGAGAVAEATGGASGQSSGAGGGGGGMSMGRPVATIVVGPDGVTVRPVVDVTKIAIAALTAWGAIGMMVVRMLRGRS